MATSSVASIKLIKEFTFEGQRRRFSNRYHFTGGTPANNTEWSTLFGNVAGAEKNCYSTDVHIVEATGYAPGSDVPIFTQLGDIIGTLGPVAPISKSPGDAAAILRWKTAAKTTKNHPIFLFSYLHGTYAASEADGDTMWATQHTAMTQYAASWLAGFPGGSIQAKRAGPRGAVAVDSTVESFIRHRDFRRTGVVI